MNAVSGTAGLFCSHMRPLTAWICSSEPVADSSCELCQPSLEAALRMCRKGVDSASDVSVTVI